MVYLLHVIPVGDDAMLNGVFEGEDASLALGLVSYIAVFLAHTDHDTLKKETIVQAFSHNLHNLAFEARIYASIVSPLWVKGQSVRTVT